LRKIEQKYINRIDNLIDKVIKKEDLKNNFNFQYFWRIYLDRWLKKYLNYKILNTNKKQFFTIKNILFFLLFLSLLWIKLYFVINH
jgi:predicted DNA-binding ribbon-helix-helix protein